MKVYELNLDGLVGPSHHYAGLAKGNIASITHAFHMANPAAAAHQGIEKMRFLHRRGLKQALLPPHARPNLALLSQLGFTGRPATQITKAYDAAPILLSACYSASSMWTANAATVSPSLDTKDKRIHFTAANLIANLHRHQEAAFSRQLLKQVFADERYFHHHSVLPRTLITSDEGAANHSRLCEHHDTSGVALFVYGKRALASNNQLLPTRFPARQTLEASEAIARSHGLQPHQVVFACQNPAAIDEGVFHNDVIAVANESLLLLHEDAFYNQAQVLAELQHKADFPLTILEISREQLSLTEAVQCYLFNSQLITLPHDGRKKKMMLVSPIECQQHPAIASMIDEFIADDSNPIAEVHYFNLKQSMQNGGGPACLRLRVALNETELSAIHQGVLVNDNLLNSLDSWVDKHYRTELHMTHLADPSLMQECFSALDELSTLLQLGSIYPFQQA